MSQREELIELVKSIPDMHLEKIKKLINVALDFDHNKYWEENIDTRGESEIELTSDIFNDLYHSNLKKWDEIEKKI